MSKKLGIGNLRYFIKHSLDGDKHLTKAVIFDADTKEEVAKGLARCHENDVFKRHDGVKRAMARALAGLNISKEERKLIWSRIWNGKYDGGKQPKKATIRQLKRRNALLVETSKKLVGEIEQGKPSRSTVAEMIDLLTEGQA